MKRSILIALLCCLSACGFHPRSPVALTPALERPYLRSHAPYGHLTQSLLADFRLSGATPVDTPKEASAIITLLSESESQTLLSVSSTQSTRQYRLGLTVTFDISDTNGRILAGPETLSESRILTMASDQILSSSNEVQILYHQIRIALVRDIMNRLSSPEISAILSAHPHVKKTFPRRGKGFSGKDPI